MQRIELIDYTAQLLQTARFKDYCPNGLQVEGATEIQHIVSGVTASMALLERAVEVGADTVMVHHGYFWKNEPLPITGIKYQRIRYLLKHDLNLIAYHLPLDAHAEFGNNVQLAKHMGWKQDGFCGEQNIIAFGEQPTECTLRNLTTHIANVLHREPLVIGADDRSIKKIAWCTGAAQHFLVDAIEIGVDVFVSGEISEQTFHLANESGVAYIAAGHHATERYGIHALGEHLAQTFRLKHSHIDIDNPV